MAGSLQQADKDQLEQWIGTGPKDFQLLYSAKRDGCVAQTFHQKCDNQGPTVTILYNDQNCVFGGYTSQRWQGHTGGQQVMDTSAFLFQLRFNGVNQVHKFPVKDASQAVYDYAVYGPLFGSDAVDLNTFNGTVQNVGGYFQLGGSMGNSSYDLLGLQVNQIHSGSMKVFDLEVYKVVNGTRAPEPSKRPWRQSPGWDETILGQVMEEVENFKPGRGLKVKEVRILMLGPVGAGKSSFFNTIDSIFKGRISHAGCSGSSEHSLTTMYRQYQVRSTTSDSFLSFRLCDTRGVEEGMGFDILEINQLLDGNIPDWYQFNPAVPISPECAGFISHPTLNERVHCVVFVVDGTTCDVIPDKVMQKFKTAQIRMTQKGIPQIVLLTKVDKICSLVEEDVSTVFKSEKVKVAVEKVSQTFGVPRGNVVPVKNYENEIQLDTSISILALLALRQMLHFSEDYLGNCLQKMETENLQKMNIRD